MPGIDDQARLMTYVDNAIVALEKQLGHIPTTDQVQTYLREQYGIEESRERIKQAGDIVLDLRDKEQETNNE